MVAQSPDTVISDTPDGERQPAIWPWLVMPAVVLLLFFTLQQLERHAQDPAVAPQSHVTGESAPAVPPAGR